MIDRPVLAAAPRTLVTHGMGQHLTLFTLPACSWPTPSGASSGFSFAQCRATTSPPRRRHALATQLQGSSRPTHVGYRTKFRNPDGQLLSSIRFCRHVLVTPTSCFLLIITHCMLRREQQGPNPRLARCCQHYNNRRVRRRPPGRLAGEGSASHLHDCSTSLEASGRFRGFLLPYMLPYNLVPFNVL